MSLKATMERFALVLVLVFASGCGHHDTEAPSSLSCSESLAAFCTTPSPVCVSHVDPENVVASYCAAAQSGSFGFGISTCGDAGAFVIDVLTSNPAASSYYDSSGNLVAIIPDKQASSCIAGPATFEVPSCTSDLVERECIHDAGTD